VKKVPNFYQLPSSSKIDYFIYFLLTFENLVGVKPKDIQVCFENLDLDSYSNIPNYLSKFSEKGKHQKYLKRGDKYFLENSTKSKIQEEINEENEPEPSDKLFSLNLFNNTRGYLQKVAKQALICYDVHQYDASLVMIRKCLEILIIECFERHNLDNKLKDKNGDFFYLSDLITYLLAEQKWNITRNTRQSLPKIKKFADLSAHNRRFIAYKNDIDSIRDDLRLIIEELLHIIDYKNWR
jgi:hypothetical protein